MLGRAKSLSVAGYRSVHRLDINFGDVNLITGPNGCGKTNLFNAFRLIRAATEGRLSQAIAQEGGFDSILWAGPRQRGPVRMSISLVAEPFEYSLELGLRPESEFPLFPLDPQFKSEIIKLSGRVMVDRRVSVAKMRPTTGESETRTGLIDSESIFAQIGDPEKYHYLYTLKELVARWMFYHEFRTDAASPLRRPATPTFSPNLNEVGDNLGVVLYVIDRRGDGDRMQQILKSAFPGSTFRAGPDEFSMEVDGIQRPIRQSELSDGTLKFLCLAAACFGVKPAPLLAFNEPETSLNPTLFEPLADMLVHASQYSQLWITTHSEELSQALVNRLDCRPIRLDKVDGETVRSGRTPRQYYSADDE